MLESDLQQAIQAIHDAPPRLVYVFAGAGSLALHWLHSVAGSSRTVLEARDCYARSSLAEIMQGVPRQAANPVVAVGMAVWAARRAAQLAESDWPLLGVGCTAAIATDRERKGDDRVAVAVSDGRSSRACTLTMAKGVRSRAEEEELASRLVLLMIARACGTPEPALPLIQGETVEEL